ncbi:MAG TPA: glycosyltransferase [Acidobacteriaceae bacterium]|nr:glycosyltransferase [Acidobacteriaceae bacterium]
MKVVIFGLTVSSSWGNGHATLWRGLCRAMVQLGHRVVFFERDVPYYAENRDLEQLPGNGRLILYSSFAEIESVARRELDGSDLAMTTSYCPDGRRAAELIFASNAAIHAFYDLDTPVTLSRLNEGEEVEYLPAEGLQGFDLVLSYTGGKALQELQFRWGARRAEPLYGSVDPASHFPVAAVPGYQSDLSYLGTYAADRQAQLERLFVETARALPQLRFILGGAQYPQDFPWTPNIYFVKHMPPPLHPAFFCSSRATLNITRRAMADYGYCPSGRLFEAAACGVPILSDAWEGLDHFLTPDREILIVGSTEDVVHALQRPDVELREIGKKARQHVLDKHTARHRVEALERVCESFPAACR